MAAIEDALRQDPQLAAQLGQIIERRDAGVHSLGDIWRRNRLSCPTREQLGSHLLGVLNHEESDFIEYHISTVGCRYCQANLDDLKQQHATAAAQAEQATKRRRKYFQSRSVEVGQTIIVC